MLKKNFSSSLPALSPPLGHVSGQKARWRSVQEPTVPGLPVHHDSRPHEPLPSQRISVSDSTHSKSQLCFTASSPTPSPSTLPPLLFAHTRTRKQNTQRRARHAVLSPIKMQRASCATYPPRTPNLSVQYSAACVPTLLAPQPASMLTLLKHVKLDSRHNIMRWIESLSGSFGCCFYYEHYH